MIRSRGTIIGLFDNAQYELANVSLMPGDKVLLFTDGFLEATNGRKEIFEEAALGRALAAHAHRPVRELMECIYKELRDFRGSDHFEDDICVVGLEVH